MYIIKYLYIFLFLLFSVAGNAQDADSKAKILYMSAEDLFNSGKYTESLAKLNQVEAEIGATNTKILFLKAHVYDKLAPGDIKYTKALNDVLNLFFAKVEKSNYPEDKYLDMTRLSIKTGELLVRQREVIENLDKFISLILANMVSIKGGTFKMGGRFTGADLKKDHYMHNVTVNDFTLSKYDVTIQQFKNFINATGYQTEAEKMGYSNVWNGTVAKKNNVNWQCKIDGTPYDVTDFDKYPVANISYNDALAFCIWLSDVSGKKFRLPTEAEWEFAAKGGDHNSNYKYSGSDNINEVGWCLSNSESIVHPIGILKPNVLGLYDMTGNVLQFCSDWYDADYYGQKISDNPQGPLSGLGRVCRGGGAVYTAEKCLNFWRLYSDGIFSFQGFRIVLIK